MALYHKNWRLKPLLRDNRLYEVAVYSGKKILVRFRDSYHLLTGKLDYLAKNLCPELGSKGSIPYNEVNIDNLGNMKESSDSSIKYVTFSKEGKSFYTNKSVGASPTSESIAPESRDAYSIPKT